MYTPTAKGFFSGCGGMEIGMQQAVARLDRQGQTKPVINTRIVCRDTMDIEVMQALENKDRTQSALMDAVKARIQRYKSETVKRA